MDVERLRDGLIVSVQAGPHSLLNTPDAIALLARVAEQNGAVAVRVEGADRISAVRRVVKIPIIGLVKRSYPGFEPYITATLGEVAEVLAAGADIVAFDATPRPRPKGASIITLIAWITGGGALAMADCAEASDASSAVLAGAAIVATTLCGYTEETRGAELPALDLVRAIRGTGAFTICEGGVSAPAVVGAAFDAGADAVVVGTAITNIDVLVQTFVAATPGRAKSR